MLFMEGAYFGIFAISGKTLITFSMAFERRSQSGLDFDDFVM